VVALGRRCTLLRQSRNPQRQHRLGHIGEVAVFVGHDFVVSNRSRSEMDLLGVRARAEPEPQH
jgi:hypothetical protein